MPKLLEVTEITLDRHDLHNRYPISRPSQRGKLAEPVRTPGIHLSGILRYLALEGGMLKAFDSDLDEEVLPLRMALGLAWEEFAVSLYPEIEWQPGERTREGIVMTSDGLSAMPVPGAHSLIVPCLEEFKLTWKRRIPGDGLMADQWYWMQQGRGYCWGYEATLVRWHVCYVMGDYRGGGPIYMRYLVLFSDDEIQKTANMLLINKDRAIEKGYCE